MEHLRQVESASRLITHFHILFSNEVALLNAYMRKGQLMLSIFLGNCPRHLFHKVHLALCFWLFRNGHHQKGCLLCSFVTKKYNTRVKEPVFCELLLSQIVGHINAHYGHFFWINSKKVTANLNRIVYLCEIAKIVCIIMFIKQKRNNDFEYTWNQALRAWF